MHDLLSLLFMTITLSLMHSAKCAFMTADSLMGNITLAGPPSYLSCVNKNTIQQTKQPFEHRNTPSINWHPSL